MKSLRSIVLIQLAIAFLVLGVFNVSIKTLQASQLVSQPSLPGPIGPQGLAGATGAQGQQGLPGAEGQTGPAGPKGDAGASGVSGEVGVQGPQGDIGSSSQLELRINPSTLRLECRIQGDTAWKVLSISGNVCP